MLSIQAWNASESINCIFPDVPKIWKIDLSFFPNIVLLPFKHRKDFI